jgi:hypothetical protein
VNPTLNSKLSFACAPVVADLARDVAVASRNVAKCQEMSRPPERIAKTNPTPRSPSAPRPLSPRMLTAAELLLAGSTVAAAAIRLGVNPRTIFRWLKQPRFRAEIDRRADLAERFRRAQAAAAVAKRQEMSRNVAVGR